MLLTPRVSPAFAGLALLAGISFSQITNAGSVAGQVLDANGNALSGIQVIYTREPGAKGASVVTVFSAADGGYSFPETFAERINTAIPILLPADWVIGRLTGLSILIVVQLNLLSLCSLSPTRWTWRRPRHGSVA